MHGGGGMRVVRVAAFAAAMAALVVLAGGGAGGAVDAMRAWLLAGMMGASGGGSDGAQEEEPFSPEPLSAGEQPASGTPVRAGRSGPAALVVVPTAGGSFPAPANFGTDTRLLDATQRRAERKLARASVRDAAAPDPITVALRWRAREDLFNACRVRAQAREAEAEAEADANAAT